MDDNTNETENEMSQTQEATSDATLPQATRTKGDKKKAKKAAGAGRKAKAAKGKSGNGGIKKVGVISEILTMLCRAEGASAKEIGDHLAKKFKDRPAEGMLTTVRIQVTRLPKRFGFEMKKTKDEKRGLVYKAPSGLAAKAAKEAGKTTEE